MTTEVTELLGELHKAGAIAYRRENEIRMRPKRAITSELLERVRRHKLELLLILPDAPPADPTPSAPTRAASDSVATDHLLFGRCPDCGDGLASARVVALCATCRRARNADALPLAPEIDPCQACGRRERWRVARPNCARWMCLWCHPPMPSLAVERAIGTTTPPYPLVVAVERIGDLPESRRSAIEADLGLLRAIVERYSRIWNDDNEVATATALGERIDALLHRLTALGARVRVAPLH